MTNDEMMDAMYDDARMPSEPKARIADLQAENTRLHDALKLRTDERDEAAEKVLDFYEQNKRINEQNARIIRQMNACHARIAELEAELAQRPASDAPTPAHDFTKDYSGDRRRLGQA